MKKVERERLKHNEAADAVAAASLFVAAHGRTLLLAAVAIVVLGAAILGYMAWKARTEERAQAMLAEAVAVAGQPVQSEVSLETGVEPGAFENEAARTDAVIAKLLATADAYPNTDAGIQARYYAASQLADANRLEAAADAFEDVRQRAGRSITGRMATLGLASVRVRTGDVETAIQTFQQLASDGGDLPVDGVLMHLADAYVHAGRQTEAVEVLRRIVNEFPQSPYASDARQRADALQADIGRAS